MPSPLATLKPLATQEMTLQGVDFRIRRITTAELSAVGKFQLLVTGLPPEKELVLIQTIRDLKEGDGDPGQIVREYVAQHLQMRVELTDSDAGKAAASEMQIAILAAGVTHWRLSDVAPVLAADGSVVAPGVPAGEWRPVRITSGAVEEEGDGQTTPDVVDVRTLPGGGTTVQALTGAILAMSGAGPQEADRVARFRRAA